MTAWLISAMTLLTFVFRILLHHERLWQIRRALLNHGQRGAFYHDALLPSSWYLPDEGVTT